MKIDKCKKASFVVIGKEGSTSDGEGFIQKLWDDANSHFGAIIRISQLLSLYSFLIGKNIYLFPVCGQVKS